MKGNISGKPQMLPAALAKLQQASRLYAASDLDGAARILRELLHEDPYNPHALVLLGSILARARHFKQAAGLFERAVVIDPDHFDAHNNLGVVYSELQRYGEAIEHYKKAIAVRPQVESYFNLGLLYKKLKRIEEAIDALSHALALKPDDPKILADLAPLFAFGGDFPQMQKHYRKLHEVAPSPMHLASLKLLLPTLLPDTREEVLELRRNFDKGLDELLTMDITFRDPARDVFRTSFLLAYHGVNNRETLKKLAQFYLKGAPGLASGAAHCAKAPEPKAKVKLGVVSSFFQGGHPVSACYNRMIEALAADPAFEVHLVSTTSLPPDRTTLLLAAKCAALHQVPDALLSALSGIARLGFDMLLYTEIGMDAITYFLPFGRLAHVQCMLPGHPDTTGIPNMDYYISSKHFGEPNVQDHYSETVIEAENLMMQAIKPAVPETFKTRAELGLPEDKNLYLCPMKMQKLHPDFDRAIDGILKRDPNGVVVLFKDKGKLPELMQARLSRTIPDTHERILYVPWATQDEFPHYLNAGDLILDPFHFGGGSTLIHVFAIGTPVVMWPSQFMRGRVAHAMFSAIGVEGLSAATQEEYVELAVKLANDKPRLAALRKEICAKADERFYDNPAGSHELCGILKDLARKHGILA